MEKCDIHIKVKQAMSGKGAFKASALAVLVARKDAWVALSIPERIVLLAEISRDIIRLVGRLVAVNLEAKGTLANPIAEAEEWVFISTMVRALRVLRESLAEIRKYGRPRISGKITVQSNGQAVAEVFPRNRLERLMFPGITGEVWMEPGVTVTETIKTLSPIRVRTKKGRSPLYSVPVTSL